MKQKVKIAKMLFAQRILKNLTQTQAGKIINVSFQQWQKYEKTTNGITAENLLIFCDKKKINISEFQNGDPYAVIEAARIFPAKKEEYFEKLDALDSLITKEETDDKSRSYENMAW